MPSGTKGKRVYPHLLPHAIAMHLLRRGADIRHVQEFLGHASIDTTKIYLRMVPGRLKEDYDKAMPAIAVKERDHCKMSIIDAVVSKDAGIVMSDGRISPPENRRQIANWP